VTHSHFLSTASFPLLELKTKCFAFSRKKKDFFESNLNDVCRSHSVVILSFIDLVLSLYERIEVIFQKLLYVLLFKAFLLL
jgi:hypothetical protein